MAPSAATHPVHVGQLDLRRPVRAVGVAATFTAVAYLLARHAVRRVGGFVPPLVASHQAGAQLCP